MAWKLAIAIMLFVLNSVASAAEVIHWTQPGWYVILDMVEDGWIDSGPYADKSQCEAAKPADEPQYDVSFFCSYLESKPAWDY